MPYRRNYGSIGSVAQNVAVTARGLAAYVYTQDRLMPGSFTTTEVRGSAYNHWVVGTGELSGAAARFRLPSDVHGWYSVVNRNFTVAVAHNASQRIIGSPFNARGTYVHRTIGLTTPSISISASGPSIGIGIGANYTSFMSPLLLIQGTTVRPV